MPFAQRLLVMLAAVAPLFAATAFRPAWWQVLLAAAVGSALGQLAVRATSDAMSCTALHDREIFGPVVTVAPYSGDAMFAAQFVARGEGCLVSSAYSDDRDWVAGFVGAAASWAGRLYLGSQKMAAQSPGPGTVLPSLVHGGPGRAGGGEELGGERGLHLYMQRCALEGDASVLKTLI